MTEIFESVSRIVFDPDDEGLILLDYRDPLVLTGLNIGGNQSVEISQIWNSLGIRTFSRGNEQHSIEFTRIDDNNNHEDALISALDFGLSLPKQSADVLISVESGSAWRIKNAIIEGWPSGNEGLMSYRTVRITGGQIEPSQPLMNPLISWDEQIINWETA